MMPFKAALLGGCLMLCAATAWAGDADVCYSRAESPANTSRLKDSTPLACGHAGTHSLAELAKAGWSIVAVSPDEEMTARMPGGVSWMVVIQKQH